MTAPDDELHATDGEQEQDNSEQERVRVCPECSEIVTFEERTCPACGHHDPLLEFPALGPGTRTCEDCGVEMLHTLLFCPSCGAERDALGRSPGPLDRDPESDHRDAKAFLTAAWLLTLLGPLALLAAVLSVYL